METTTRGMKTDKLEGVRVLFPIPWYWFFFSLTRGCFPSTVTQMRRDFV